MRLMTSNLVLYKILEASKQYNYDESDMGEPGTVYIPPIEVSVNGPGHLWGARRTRSIGGGPPHPSRHARVNNRGPSSKKALTNPTGTDSQAWLDASLRNRHELGQETNGHTRQSVESSSRSAAPLGNDEDARQEFPIGNSNSNPGRNTQTDQNSEPGNGGLIRMIIHEYDAFAFLNDDSN